MPKTEHQKCRREVQAMDGAVLCNSFTNRSRTIMQNWTPFADDLLHHLAVFGLSLVDIFNFAFETVLSGVTF